MNGCPVSNVSCSELRFSSIDSSVAFNFDCPFAFCWATVCIIPNNFAINSSVFEPIWFTEEPFVEVSLSGLGLVILWSLWLYVWLLVRLVSVAAGAPSWFVLLLLLDVFVLVSTFGFSGPIIKGLQVMEGVVSYVMSDAWINWISLLKITDYLLRFASCLWGVGHVLNLTCSINWCMR